VDWLFSNFGVVVFVIVVISMVRAAVKAAQLSGDHQAQQSETEEQRRVREIQERIRRKIAERRGEPVRPTVPAEPAERAFVPPVLSRPSAPLDPFGGPMKRLVTQLERRIQQPPPARPAEQTGAVLERQKKLAEEMRVIEETQALVVRRAAAMAATQKSDTESESGMRTSAREELLADLRETSSQRRAFVLREVLGAPVALR
jgi:hypothetical protein